MLSKMRQSWALFALFAIISLSTAMSIDEALHIDGIAEYLNVHGKRQDASGTGATTESPSETPTPSADPSSEPPEETTSPTPTPSDDPSSDEPSSTAAPSTNAPSSSNGQTSGPNSTPASTAAPSKSSATTPVIKTTPLVGTSVQSYTTIITTISNGQSVEITSTGESTLVSTTGTALTTETPVPQNGDGGSGGGLTDSNKKIIGGVVGGVGGAILLGGIAIVCWRIWGRKNRVSEDDDDLVAGTGSALGDKHSGSTANGSSPFQSNLEQYHNPGGRPNAAANF